MLFQVFDINISLKSLCIILLFVFAIFFLIVALLQRKNRKEILSLEETVEELEANQRINPGETKNGYIYLHSADLVYKDQEGNEEVGTVNDFIKTTLEGFKVKELYVPYTSISTNGFFQVETKYGYLYVRPSNLKDKYTISVKSK